MSALDGVDLRIVLDPTLDKQLSICRRFDVDDESTSLDRSVSSE